MRICRKSNPTPHSGYTTINPSDPLSAPHERALLAAVAAVATCAGQAAEAHSRPSAPARPTPSAAIRRALSCFHPRHYCRRRFHLGAEMMRRLARLPAALLGALCLFVVSAPAVAQTPWSQYGVTVVASNTAGAATVTVSWDTAPAAGVGRVFIRWQQGGGWAGRTGGPGVCIGLGDSARGLRVAGSAGKYVIGHQYRYDTNGNELSKTPLQHFAEVTVEVGVASGSDSGTGTCVPETFRATPGLVTSPHARAGINPGWAQYQVTPTFPRSKNANLSTLTASASTSATGSFNEITLTPSFDKSKIAYTASVTNIANHVKLTPTVEDAKAKVKVGTAIDLRDVTSGSASHAIPLTVGENSILAVVTAEDPTVDAKTYTFTITRAGTDPPRPTVGHWSANLKIQDLSDSLGCDRFLRDFPKSCGNMAVLDDNDFTFAGSTYEITGLQYTRASKNFKFITANLPPAGSAFYTLILMVDGQRLPMSGASVGPSRQTAEWTNVDLNWSAGNSATLSLVTERVLPTISSVIPGAEDGKPKFTVNFTNPNENTYDLVYQVKLPTTLQWPPRTTNHSLPDGVKRDPLGELDVSNEVTGELMGVDKFTGLEKGTAYDLRAHLATVNAPIQVASLSTGVLKVTTWDIPGPPTNVRTTASDRQLVVNWAAPTNTGGSGPIPPTITGYQLQYKESTAADQDATGNDPATGWVAIARTLGGTSYTITGLTDGKFYQARVRALNGINPGSAWASPPLSTNANLSTLTINGGSSASDTSNSVSFTPSFEANMLTYTAVVARTITHVQLTPSVADTGKATVLVGKAGTTLHAADTAISLAEGNNVLHVEVTAESGAKKVYAITLLRGSVWAGVLNVRRIRENLVGCHTVRAQLFCSSGITPENRFTIGATDISLAQVSISRLGGVKNTVSAGFLGVGESEIETLKKLQFCVGTQAHSLSLVNPAGPDRAIGALLDVHNSYTFMVNDKIPLSIGADCPTDVNSFDAYLSAFELHPGTAVDTFGSTALTLTPEFATTTFTYTASVTSATTHLRVTPTARVAGKATIRAGKQGVDPSALSGGTHAIELVEGENILDVVVTAEDGINTRTYSATVFRQRVLDIALTAASRVYGDTGSEDLSYILENLFEGDTQENVISGELSREEGDDAGEYAIDLSGLSIAEAYAGKYALPTETTPAVYTITPKVVRLSGDGIFFNSYDGDTAVAETHLTEITVEGEIDEDALNLFITGGEFADKDVGVGKEITNPTFALVAVGGDDDTTQANNYSLPDPIGVTLNAGITPASINAISEVTVNEKIADGNIAATFDTSAATGTGVVAGELAEFRAGGLQVSGSFPAATAGTYDVTVTYSLTDNGSLFKAANYEIAAEAKNATLQGIINALTRTFSIADATAAEGANAELIITLGENVIGSELVFNVTTTFATGGSDDADENDVGDVPNTVTVEVGSKTATLSIPLARDADEERNETFTVTITPSVNGWQEASTGDGTATVAITDTTEALSFKATSLTTTYETGTAQAVVERTGDTGTIEFTVSTADGTATAGTDYTALSAASYTIADGEREVAVPITILADDEDEDDETFTATIAGVAADSGYRITGGALSVTITDDDTADVNVAPTSVTVTEASGDNRTATYTVVLTSKPTHNVVVTPTSSATADATVSGALTFTPSDWDTAQSVTVTAVDDAEDEDAESVTVTHQVTSMDGKYSALTPANISLTATITDDDTAAIDIGATSVTVTEASGARRMATYAVVLESKPTANVTVTPNIGTADDVTVSAALTFTPSDWDTAQSVTVTAVDDAEDEDAESVTVTHQVTSTDSKYANLTPPSVTANITDDDIAGVTPSKTSVSLTVGDTATYSLVLASRPAHNVEITPTSGASDKATVSGTLTFTPDKWNEAQVITITGKTIGNSTISHAAVSTDPKYDGAAVSITDVTATVQAVPTVAFSAATYRIAENGNADSVIMLQPSAAPASDITVPLTWTAGTAKATDDYTAGDDTITLSSGSTPPTDVAFMLTDDSLVENDEQFTISLTAPSGYAAGTPSSATITITDDDAAAAKIAFGTNAAATSAHSANVDEDAGTLDVPITVSHLPSASTTFAVSVLTGSTATEGASNDFTIATQSVTFAPTDVNNGVAVLTKNLVITIVDDTLDDDAETIQLRIDPADSTVNDLGDHYTRDNTGATATITIVDDDKSTNADLSALTAATDTTSGGTFATALTLAPATFDADVLTYTASVASTTTHLKVTPTVAATGKATIAAGKRGTTPSPVTDKTASAAIDLAEGGNFIDVVVTADNGSTTKSYTLAITRARVLEIALTNPSRAYGGTDDLSYSLSNLFPGDAQDDVISGDLTRGPGDDAGEYAINPSGLRIAAAYTDKYELPSATKPAVYTITPKLVTLTGDAVLTKTYDGDTTITAAELTGVTVASGVSGESLTLTLTAGAYDNQNVGTSKTIENPTFALVPVEASGTTASNYSLPSPIPLSGTIVAKSTTFTGTAAAREYDGTDTVNTTISGNFNPALLGSDTVTITGGTYDSAEAGAAKPITGASKGGADANNYEVTIGTITGEITKKPTTFTATVPARAYNGSDQVGSGTAISGSFNPTLLSGDVVTITGGTYASADVGVGHAITDSTIGGADGGNYDVTLSVTGSIDKATITAIGGVSVNAKTADDTTTATFDTTAATGTGVVTGELADFRAGGLQVRGSFAAATAGTHNVGVTYSLADSSSFKAANYEIASGVETATLRGVINASTKTFSLANATAAEGANAELTITLGENAGSSGLEFGVATTFATGSDKAAANDVGTVPGTVTVAANSKTATLTIPLKRDADEENSETFTVTITTSVSGWQEASAGDGTATVTITDTTEALSFKATSLTTTYETGTAQAVVERTGDTGTIEFTVSTADGTATAGTDYTALSAASYTIADGEREVAVPITILADDEDEDDETFTATIAGVAADSGYRITGGALTVTITDAADDTAAIDIAPTSVTVTEESGDARTATYTVVLESKPTAEVTVTPNIGSADDVTVSGALTFTPSDWDTAQSVTVTAVDDAEDEDAESVTVTHQVTSMDGKYSALTPANISLTATITDDDTAAIDIGATSVTVTEASGARRMATYAVVLESKPTANVTVTPNIGTADDVTVSAALTFTPSDWDTAQSVTVTAVDDAVDEDAESVTVTHQVASADGKYSALTPLSVTANITDDDTAGVTPSETSVSLTVGDTATYSVVLASRPTHNVEITPTSGAADKATVSGTLTFTPDKWNEAQVITITGKAIGNSTISHAAVSTDPKYDGAAVSITDVTATVQAVPTVAFSAATYSIAEGGDASSVIKLQPSAAPTSDITVPLNWTAGTAKATDDYTAGVATITLSSGSTTPTDVAFTLTDDSLVENDEQFTISLTAPSGYAAGTPSSATITITDDDAAAAKIAFGTNSAATTAYSANVDENAGTLNVPITVSHLPSESTTFVVSVLTDGTATEGASNDFTIATQSVTFTPTDVGDDGNPLLTQNLVITIEDDTLDDDAETIQLRIDPADSTVNDLGDHYTRDNTGATATITIVDDDKSTNADLSALTAATDTSADGDFTTPLTLMPTFQASERTYTASAANTATHLKVTPTVAASDKATVEVSRVNSDPVPVSSGEAIELAEGANEVRVVVTAEEITITNTYTLTVTRAASTVNKTFSIANATAAEGADAELTITLGEDATGSGLAFDVATAFVTGNDNAAANDVGTVPGTVTVAADSNTATLTIPLKRDADEENDETFTVTITTSESDWQEASAGSGTATVTITDTTEALRFKTNPLTTTETGTAQAVVERTGGTTGAIEFTVSTADGAATAGSDYTALSAASYTIADGQSEVNVPIRITADKVDEDNETFTATIAGVAADTGYRITGDALSVTITDDDESRVDIAPTSVTVTEEEGDNRTATYTVVLASKPTHDVEVTPTSGATADATVSGALTFTPDDWDTEQSVTVTAVDDDVDEDAESVTVNHQVTSADTKYSTLTLPNVTANITDDDTAGVTPSETSVSLEMGDTATYTLVLASRPTHNVVITPTSGATDTATVSGALTFTPDKWNEAQEVTITGKADGNSTISHSAVSTDAKYNGISIAAVSATVQTMPKVSFAAINYSVNEGDEVTLTVSIAPQLDTASSVTIETRTGAATTAATPADYTLSGLTATTLTLPASMPIATFTLSAVDDDTSEGAEQVTFRLAAVSVAPYDVVTTGGVNQAVVAIADTSTTSAPGNFAVTAGDGTLDLSWSAPAGGLHATDRYDVQYKTAAATDQPATTANDPTTGWVDAAHSGTTTTDSLTGLINGTTYNVRVRAISSHDEAGEWATADGTPAAPQSSNNNLSNLVAHLSADGTNFSTTALALAPAFDSATTEYVAAVAASVTHIRLTATAADDNAQIQARKAGGTFAALTSGTAGSALALDSGDTTFEIEVTAEDGMKRTYTLKVTRTDTAPTLSDLTLADGGSALTLTPAFAAATTAYATGVPSATTNLSVTPTWSAGAGISVSAQSAISGGSAITTETAIASSASSATVNLAASGDTTVIVEIVRRVQLAAGTSTDQTSRYTITVSKPPATAPSSLTVSAGDGQLDLSWSAPAGTVGGYTVQYKKASTSGDTVTGDADTGWVEITGITDTMYTITDLENDAEYVVRARAANAGGDGPWAAQQQGTPAQPSKTWALAPATATVLEGGVAELIVTLSEDAPAVGLAFTVQAIYGTANDADVGPVPGRVTVAGGERTATLRIPIEWDARTGRNPRIRNTPINTEGDETFTIQLTSTNSAWTPQPAGANRATITIKDNNVRVRAEAEFSPRYRDPTNGQEGSTIGLNWQATYNVVLSSRPENDVVVTATSQDPTTVTITPAVLTFTPSNWDQVQKVTFTGVGLSYPDPATISHAITTADAASGYFTTMPIADYIVRVVTPTITLGGNAFTGTEPPNGPTGRIPLQVRTNVGRVVDSIPNKPFFITTTDITATRREAGVTLGDYALQYCGSSVCPPKVPIRIYALGGSGDYSLTGNRDNVVEGDETFEVTLEAPEGYVIGGIPRGRGFLGPISEATMTIIDREAPLAKIAFGDDSARTTAYTATVSESVAGGQILVPITINYPTQAGTTATFSVEVVTDGDNPSTATAADFTITNDSVSYSGGATNSVRFPRYFDSLTKNIVINLNDDLLVEPNETIQLRIVESNPDDVTHYYQRHPQGSTAIITITSDESTDLTGKRFAVARTAAADEGDSARITVSLGEAAPTGGLAFTIAPTYESGAGKASASDVGTIPQSVTVQPGQTTASVNIPLKTDSALEGSETFKVTLTPPQNSEWSAQSEGRDAAMVTIRDVFSEKLAPTASSYRVDEGGTVVVTVTRGGDHKDTAVFNYSAVAGTATILTDFAAATNLTGTFSPDESTKELRIATIQDTVIEGDEVFGLEFWVASDSGYFVETQDGAKQFRVSYPITIVDDDRPASTDATLSNLTASSNTSADGTFNALPLTPSFAATTLTYTASVEGTTSHAKLRPKAADANATITVGKRDATAKAVDNDTDSDAIALDFGVNTIDVVITAEDGTTTETYTAMITRARIPTFSITATASADEGASASLTITLSEAAPTGGLEFSVTPEYATTGNDNAVAADVGTITTPVSVPEDGTTFDLTIPLVDDDLDENDETFKIVIATTTPRWVKNADGADTATITITDNDDAGIDIGTTATYRVTEDADDTPTATYTVKLTSKPTENVVVTPTSGAAADATVSGTLTFTPANWNVEQPVTITAVDDDLDEGIEERISVTHQVTSTDTSYSGLTVSSLEVYITDDDMAGFTVDPTTLTIDEGTSNTYTVVLTSQPTNNVVVTPTSGDTDKVTVEPDSYMFTSTNWNMEKIFTVTSVEEDDDYDNNTVTITHAATSDDTQYAALTPDPVEVTVTDNDTRPTFSITPTATAVEGKNVSLTITLSENAPDGGVPFTIMPKYTAGSGKAVAADVSAVPTSVTVPVNSNSHSFNIPLEDDDLDEDDETFEVVISTTTIPWVKSADGADTATITITDNDEAGIDIGTTATYRVTEAAGDTQTATYNVKLTSKPAHNVTVTPASSATADATVGGALTFTPENWNITQPVTITAVDDKLAEGDERIDITHGVTSTDDKYNGLSEPPSLAVYITDDDTAGFTVDPTTLDIMEGASKTYTVVLNSQPTHTVTVTATSPDIGAVTFTPSSRTFSTLNWGTAQEFTVTGVQDGDATNESVVISHEATGSDTSYSALTPDSVTVNVTDDDMEGFTVTPTTLPIREGETGTYTVVLNTAPSANVVVTPTSADTGAVTFTPSSRTFSTLNWGTAQEFTVTGVQDGDATNESVVISHEATGSDTSYSALTPESVTVTVTDDETPPQVPQTLTLPPLTDLTYTVNRAITPVTLPQATGGSGALTYALTPVVAGLPYDAATRRFTGTPTTVAETQMTYMATDGNGARAEQTFTLRIIPEPSAIAQTNRIVLPEVARAMADQTVGSVRSRVRQAGRESQVPSAALNGQQTLAGVLVSHGPGMADGTGRLQDLLGNSDFALPLNPNNEATGGLASTLWGQSDFRDLTGDSDGIEYNGELFSARLGADRYLRNDLMVGAALSWNQADVTYRNADGRGEYELDLKSFHPYMGKREGSLEWWATIGHGTGELKVLDAAGRWVSDVRMNTAAVGGSGRIWKSDRATVRLKGEAMGTRLYEKGYSGLDLPQVDVTLVRFAVDGARKHLLRGGWHFLHAADGGFRYDGSDGNTGAGFEASMSWRYSHPARGVRVEYDLYTLQGRAGDYSEWGARGLLRLAAGADGQGLSFSLRPGWGSEIGDPQRMWEQGLRGALASDTAANPSARLEVRMGYGVSSRTGLLTPWGGVALNGDDKRYRVGLDWSPDGPFSLSLSGELHETTNADASHAVMLKGDVRF